MKAVLAIVCLSALVFQGVKAEARAQNSSSSSLTTHADSDESGADDHLVKVRLSPWVMARPGVSGDVNMQLGSSGFTAGLLGEYLTTEEANSKISMSGVGLNATYFFKGSPFVSSWYVAPAFLYRTGRIDLTHLSDLGFFGDGSTASADFDVYTLQAMVGYQWHWDHFNLSLAGGPTQNTLTVKNVRGHFNGGIFSGGGDFSSGETSSTSFGGAALELAFGWSI